MQDRVRALAACSSSLVDEESGQREPSGIISERGRSGWGEIAKGQGVRTMGVRLRQVVLSGFPVGYNAGEWALHERAYEWIAVSRPPLVGAYDARLDLPRGRGTGKAGSLNAAESERLQTWRFALNAPGLGDCSDLANRK